MRERMTALLGAMLLLPVLILATGTAAEAQSVSCTGESWSYTGSQSMYQPSRGNYTGDFDCVLGIGNQGRAVRTLQDLSNAGYWAAGLIDIRLEVDGIYGPRTAEAVRQIQRHGNISVDGTYGPQTCRAMRRAIVNSNKSCV